MPHASMFAPAPGTGPAGIPAGAPMLPATGDDSLVAIIALVVVAAVLIAVGAAVALRSRGR